MNHLISIDDLSEKDIEVLFDRVGSIKNKLLYLLFKDALKGKILTNLFYEPSTRTSSSFHAAMLKLGGEVLSVNEINYSSVSKGENLQDTIRTMGCYSDIIVLRSQNEGDAKLAAEVR